MTIDRRIIEQIEACRPLSNDLAAEEFADAARRVAAEPLVQARYARTQRWDAKVVAAMDRVAVPEGLADRILQSLGRSVPASTSPLAAAVAEAATTCESGSVAVAPPDAAPRPARSSRRNWLSIGAAVAATVVVATFVARYVTSGDEATVESMAESWLSELEPKWQNMESVPRGFDLPGAITAQATGWQRIGQIGQVRGIAYKLAHATGTARLFVVRLSKAGVPGSPPPAPQSTTGGKSVGYWHTGGLVYVLVVDGNVRNYRAFVSSAGMPLA